MADRLVCHITNASSTAFNSIITSPVFVPRKDQFDKFSWALYYRLANSIFDNVYVWRTVPLLTCHFTDVAVRKG